MGVGMRVWPIFAAVTALSVGSANAQTAQQPDGTLLDRVQFFVGLDGSKQPQDLGINANMGVRFSTNAGFPVLERYGIGAQAGVAANLSDAAVHVLDQIEGTSRRTQMFVTLGVFSRSEHFNWAIAHDVLYQDYFDTTTVSQWRGEAGWLFTKVDEVGAWFTVKSNEADALMGETPVHLEPISMINAYSRRTWASSAVTTLWVGVANGHHDIVWVLPASPRSEHVAVYGAELSLPLNSRMNVTGAANFITPTSTGTVDAYLGVSFYPGRRGSQGARDRFAPMLTVANNPTMAQNLSR